MKAKDNSNILFFYSELAAYFLACAEFMHIEFGYQVHIVHWPINPEAPFAFRNYKGVHLIPKGNKTRDDLFSLYQDLSPKLVYSIGWMDPDYKDLAKRIRADTVPVVAGMDNHWTGSIRQLIASWISPFYLKPFFSHLWVPGKPQMKLAKKLGFSNKQILTGLYSADLYHFHQAYERYKEEKELKYPHNFLFVGRFVEVKGVLELVNAFEELGQEISHDWTLTLVGTGALKGQIHISERIVIKDFVQPEKLPDLAKDAGCFILPSLHEPWGVVLHEFAGAGLPLISSENCGAASTFLEDGENGYSIRPHSIEAIKKSLQKIVINSDQELIQMGEKSYELSKQISPEIWSKTLLSVLEKA